MQLTSTPRLLPHGNSCSAYWGVIMLWNMALISHHIKKYPFSYIQYILSESWLESP